MNCHENGKPIDPAGSVFTIDLGGGKGQQTMAEIEAGKQAWAGCGSAGGAAPATELTTETDAIPSV